MGNPFGRPDDHQNQREILQSALELAARSNAAGIMEDHPSDWGEKILSLWDLSTTFKISAPDPKTGKQQT